MKSPTIHTHVDHIADGHYRSDDQLKEGSQLDVKIWLQSNRAHSTMLQCSRDVPDKDFHYLATTGTYWILDIDVKTVRHIDN